MKLSVKAADDERQNVEVNYELPDRAYCVESLGNTNRKGEVKTEYYQRFKLQPNSYVFSLCIMLSENNLKDSHVEFLMKVGSTSECTIEEIKYKT